MKKFTNYAPGARGVTVKLDGKDGGSETIWIEPGETASIDPKLIVEPMPDLGTKPADDGSADEIEALTARNAELEALVEDQGKQIATLTADLEKATKPAK